jgi:predicted enzyme related to lactoylglutathione lyase
MPRPVHFELQASDPAALQVFYAAVFGWTFEKWGDQDYWVISTGDEEMGINGGLLARTGPPPPDDAPITGTTLVIGVADCQAHLDRAIAAGAHVALARTEVPGVGFMAYAKDPDGNLFGILEPSGDR